jgi:hypothetical protein
LVGDIRYCYSRAVTAEELFWEAANLEAEFCFEVELFAMDLLIEWMLAAYWFV